ncbi:hypothetical protein [Cellulomonas sp. ATA003]|uniref:hypothetical protein n=1 Tax=Cellulomonas sp. ATA003 TaxID=3073064 RepID=UPI0028736596|nr:hypothetical protein [Cellulomonas sp. ATA003]WNB86921.1 hypothetical protein REH70_07115 [Cellulomonas sp. ATA003]
MTIQQHHDVATVLLDALVALDPDDQEGSSRAVPLALARLGDVVGDADGPVSPVAFGALELAHVCVALVAGVKDVDRLDVIAALRPLFAGAGGTGGAGGAAA